jgi:hypothetical protein
MPGSTEVLAPSRASIYRNIDWEGAYATVLGQNHSYLSHGPVMSTLGLPLYLANSDREYFEASAANNAVMWSCFGWLIEAMVETLESVLRVPIVFDPRLALPGFHIFKTTEITPFSGGVWHIDVFRYELIPPPRVSYSATLLLGDSETSYGIDYRTNHTDGFFQHQIGAVTIFNSALQHRLAPVCPSQVPKARVTLQAHIWMYPQYAIAFW